MKLYEVGTLVVIAIVIGALAVNHIVLQPLISSRGDRLGTHGLVIKGDKPSCNWDNCVVKKN